MPEKLKRQKETPENEPKFLGTIILKRHAEPLNYHNVSPSLKPDAEAGVVEDGKHLRSEIPEDTDITFVSSPLLRAQETMQRLLEGMGVSSETPIHETRTIRSMDNRGEHSENRAVYNSFNREGQTMAEHSAAVQAAMEDPNSVFNVTPKLFETKSSRDKRTAIAMEFAIRFFEKYQREKQTKNQNQPLIIAVSHGELIGAFVEPLLGIDLKQEPPYQYSEEMSMYLLQNPSIPAEVVLHITYRGQEKDVIFNRDTRTFTPVEPTSA